MALSGNPETHPQVNFTLKITYLQISGNWDTDVIEGMKDVILSLTNTLNCSLLDVQYMKRNI